MDVADWLRGLELQQYEQSFRDNHIGPELLPELTAEDLISLGVGSIGHRRKMLIEIARLRDVLAHDSPATNRTPPPALPEAARRQATVLFADLAGFTRMSEELDAEEVHELLGRFFELVDGVIAEYGGTVDKHIGDCVMAVFGAPRSQGNDLERCVRAALEIQTRLPALSAELGRQIAAHIGIASGQVVASGTGSSQHQEYTVTGESVNLASRLTDEAAGGEILISNAARRVLADKLQCADPRELAVKGFAKPVRAWRLLSWSEAKEASGYAFVGRRSELQQLETVIAACRASSYGQTIYIRGDAGIGKTRLLMEFQIAAKRAGFACHRGLVLNFGYGTGQDAIRSLVNSLLDVPTGGDRTAVKAAAERAFQDGLALPQERVHLNDLLDLPQPTELRTIYDAMDHPTRNRGKAATLAGIVARASSRQPLLLAVEDLHWADEPTLDALANLTGTIAACPTVLVLTSRIEGDPLDGAWRSRARTPLTTIDLAPLQPSEAELLAGPYREKLGELAQRCIDRAAGNPLFLEQLLRHAEEHADAGVPDSVQSLVQARLDQLRPLDKQALQAASVLGQRFTTEALDALLNVPAYDCSALVQHLLIRPEEDRFLFAHALIQEGTYDSLLKGRRRELHRRAAGWFQQRDLTLYAEHLDQAEHADAARAYLEAARSQAAEYRTERALRLVERGLALARERADVYALTQLHGEVLHDLGLVPDTKGPYL